MQQKKLIPPKFFFSSFARNEFRCESSGAKAVRRVLAGAERPVIKLCVACEQAVDERALLVVPQGFASDRFEPQKKGDSWAPDESHPPKSPVNRAARSPLPQAPSSRPKTSVRPPGDTSTPAPSAPGPSSQPNKIY
jgi:hypothetical protein